MIKKNLQKISCPLCTNDAYKVLFSSTLVSSDFSPVNIKNNLKNTLDDYHKHSRIVKCRTCGLVYTNPMEDPTLLLHGYKDVEDKEYLQTESYRKVLLKKHLEYINQYKKKGNILDIGSFVGFFLELAKTEGRETYGIEPSVWARSISKTKGIKNIGKDILSARIPPDQFDAVTMFDVIEHLSNPHEVLTKINKIIKKDGILVIATPDIESIFAKVLGKNCPFLVRMHVILYSPKTMSMLLEKHGFKILNISYYGRTFPISYFLDRIQVKNNVLREIISLLKKAPVIPNLSVTLNFRDSFRIIAKKSLNRVTL